LRLKHLDITAEPERSDASIEQTLKGRLDRIPVRYHKKKDGSIFPVEISASKFTLRNQKVLCGVIRDITENKRIDEKLRERGIELEKKTISLEEINTAMKIVLKKREEDKKDIEDNVLINVKQLIAPYFEKIKKTKLDDQQKTILSIIESNMNEIISPFTRKMSLKYLNLTPTEIRIANLITHGNSSKKIAELLNASPRTIDTHRKNIRRKIGLQGKKANLMSHLLSFD